MSEPSDPKPEQGSADDEVLFAARDEQASPAEAEADAPTPADGERPPAPAKAPRGGRLLGSLALVVSLAALAGVGFLFYELRLKDPLAPVTARLDAVDAETRQLADAMAGLRSERDSALREFDLRQQQSLTEAREGLLESLNQVASQGPPSAREWKVAEVAYLLRIANHRLLMERDVAGALELLTAADAILTELDDFAFYQVRSRLAVELRALEGVESNDLSGLFLRLEALKDDLQSLPLKLPEYVSTRREQAQALRDADGTFWDKLLSQLSSSFRMRRFETDLRPLLSPEEAVYLELNLRLMIERAQLAALKRDQLVFSRSLDTAAGWLLEYLDPEDTRVQRAVGELKEIATITLDEELPDISGSLTALQGVRGES